tara:strand:+ start:1051 stop:2094 length:1044 start_codon:yes stop_codon:yes gene_type:complete
MHKNNELSTAWNAFKSANPKVRIRDAATTLGVSEVELVATECSNETVRLTGNWQLLIRELVQLDRVMALTRNEYAVSEKKGIYQNIRFHGPIGLVLDSDIDLRLFMDKWESGFSVTSIGHKGPLKSFQFFDKNGTAVHKIYLTDKSDHHSYAKLTEKFASRDQSNEQLVSPVTNHIEDLPDAEINIHELEHGWEALQDTHDFDNLLKKCSVGRVQAFRLVKDKFAFRVGKNSLRNILQSTAENKIRIMIFVNSPGTIQIHSGLISNVVCSGTWINVMDDNFNLHVREDKISSAWVICKPTKDGLIWSLELFDHLNETIALLFAKRHEGKPPPEAWEKLLLSLDHINK